MSQISTREAVALGAVDSIVYSQFFFPGIIHQETPEFHRRIWQIMERNRQWNMEIFRGGAKTTIARVFVSKRIAYGLGHTILFVSKSEEHAAESVMWLKTQVEYNQVWAKTFDLSPGEKWTGTDIEIRHGIEKYPIRVKALGIQGSIRGINVQGRRPDTIVCDDPVDEENSSTPDQRNKISDLFFGALIESLVPASEDPSACVGLLQTPFVEDDLSGLCNKSSDFASLHVPIITDEGRSAWPSRWTLETILAEKQAATERNKLSLWLREKMCQITSKETSEFLSQWLKYYEILPPGAIYVGAIDPAPILSDKSRALGVKTDLQAIMVCCYWRGLKYIVEYATARDQDPEAVARELDRLSRKYPIRRWGVEGVAYQRTLKWYLEREMQAGRLKHLRILEIPAPKGKHERIVQAHAGRASSGSLYVHRSHTEYIEQFVNFPNVKFRDLLDVSAMCDMTITPRQEGSVIEGEFSTVDEGDIQDLPEWRASP